MQVSIKQSQHKKKKEINLRTSPLLQIKQLLFILMLHQTSTIYQVNYKINSFLTKQFRNKIYQLKRLLNPKFKLLIINKFIPIFSTINRTKSQCIYRQFQNNKLKISIKSISTHNLLVEVSTIKRILAAIFLLGLTPTSEFKKLMLIMIIFQTTVEFH